MKMTQEEIDARNAKAAATSLINVRRVARMLHLPSVGRIAVTPKAGISHVVFNPTARIVILKNINPYRKGCGRWQRYETLCQASVVQDFTMKWPENHSTLTNAVLNGLITIEKE
jgi:hypothetical protein